MHKFFCEPYFCFVDLHIANFIFTLKRIKLYCWRIWSIFAARWVKRIIRKMYLCYLCLRDNLSIFSVGGAKAGNTGTAIIQRVSQGQQGVLQTQVCLVNKNIWLRAKKPSAVTEECFSVGLSPSWQVLVKIPISEKYCPLFIYRTAVELNSWLYWLPWQHAWNSYGNS